MNEGSSSAEVPLRPEGIPAATHLWRLWQLGESPDLGEFLGDAVISRSEMTTLAVLRVDQRERWLRGERVLAEEYAVKLPAAVCSDELLLDLLCSELQLRAELDVLPTLEELKSRFPRLAVEIEQMYRVQREWLWSSEDETLDWEGDTAFPVGPPAAETEAAASGPRVGAYRILYELGSGGMGVVYRAHDTRLKRDVALKMILPGRAAGTAELSRFRLEAEVAAGLQHPHIVQVFEIGEHEGRLFTCMELVHGGSLAERIRREPLPAGEAAELLETVARAVHYAHERGVLHRDLKPGNILLSSSGQPKVSDFGLAKRLDDDAGRTHTGTLLGTPCYIPPEQARGDLQQLGPRSDVYSLGAVLYEALTGRPPFRGETLYDTLGQVCTSEPLAPRRLLPGLPPELETICLKCLAKQPARRYRSALELAQDLRRFLNHEPILARPAGLVERTQKLCRRRPALAALVAVSVLAASGLLAGGLIYNTRLSAALGVATHEANAARAAESVAQERLDSARRALFAMQLGQAAASLRRDPALAVRLLEDELRCPPELRDFSWRYLHRLCQPRQQALALPAEVRCVAFHPGTGVAAVGCADHSIYLWQLDAALPAEPLPRLTGHQGPINSICFDAEGRYLASASDDGTARLWDVQAGILRTTLPDQIGHVNAVAMSPTQPILATAGADRRVRLWNLPDGELQTAMDGHEDSVFALAFSSEGNQLASAGKDRSILLWDVASGEQTAELAGHAGWITCLAFAPQSDLLASGGVDRTVMVWDLATRQPRRTLQGHRGVVSGLAFTADALASAGYEGTFRLWDPQTGEVRKTLRAHPDSATSLWISAPGDRLLTGGGKTARLWDLGDSLESDTIAAHQRPVTVVAFVDGDRRLVTGAIASRTTLRDAATGETVATLADHDTWVTCLAASLDGSKLATGRASGDVTVWDAQTQQRLAQFAGDSLSINALAFAPDAGSLVVTGTGDRSLGLWDVSSGQVRSLVKELSSEGLCLAFHPRHNQVACGLADGAVLLVDLAGGVDRLETRQPDVRTLAYSPDGELLAIGSSDGTGGIWKLSNRKLQGRLLGHTDAIACLAFTADGLTLVTGSRDQTVRLWDPRLAHQRLVLDSHAGAISCLAVSSDGSLLAAGAESGTVKMWRTSGP